MIKLTDLEKKETQAGVARTATKIAFKFFEAATGVVTFTSLSSLILDVVIKYFGGTKKMPPVPAKSSIYSLDSPAAHEQWLKMQEVQRKKPSNFY